MNRLVAAGVVAGVVATGLLVPGCRGASAPMSGGAFVADDFPRAVEEARRTKRPIFVDAWAVWCKPCREMQEVFDDPRLGTLRERFDLTERLLEQLVLARTAPPFVGPDQEALTRMLAA